jgi:23S rRNA (uracil1939-C5)-methyltransferase
MTDPTVRIRDRNQDGRGRGDYGDRIALVCHAHPGEEVQVRVDRETRGTLQGRVRRWQVRDPRRIQHSCAHELACTGCPLLAVAAEEEQEFKLERVRAAAEQGGAARERVAPVLRPSGLFGYRHYAKQVFAAGPVLGSYVAGTHEVANNAGCPVLAPALANLLEAVAGAAAGAPLHGAGRAGLRYALARQSALHGEQLLVLVTSGDPAVARDIASCLLDQRPRLVAAAVVSHRGQDNVLLGGDVVARLGVPVIEEELLGFRHRIGPNSFFQINPIAASSLFATAVAGAGEGEVCVDAYAGVGALTLPLTRRFARVVAIECAGEAAASLAEREVGNLEVHAARVEEALPAVLASARPSTVVLDPPRRGVGDRVAEMVCDSSARRAVLLTCGLGALARDLEAFAAGGFEVDAITPVDQFPRTGHVECVSVLQR